MRTARRVIVCLLAFAAAGVLWAQQPRPAEGSVDSSVTVTGRDDSVIAVPAPADLQEVMPSAESLLEDMKASLAAAAVPGFGLVPPVAPPVADIALPPRDVLVPYQPRTAAE